MALLPTSVLLVKIASISHLLTSVSHATPPVRPVSVPLLLPVFLASLDSILILSQPNPMAFVKFVHLSVHSVMVLLLSTVKLATKAGGCLPPINVKVRLISNSACPSSCLSCLSPE